MIGMNEGDPAPLTGDDAARRSFLTKFAALVCGGIVTLFPFAAGLGVMLDPWWRSRKSAAANGGASANADNGKFVRICSLDAVPNDGVPRPFAVVTDVVDAWTHASNQRVGMVFLEHSTAAGKSNVLALNAKCPHLGCFVDFDSAKGEFECPCHKSAFAKDGNYIFGPSLRGLDPLKVDLRKTGETTEVYVAFQKFQPGIAERKPVE
jgi:quinol---cytochrome c reductase iron-sulfur subunit, bacillus type